MTTAPKSPRRTVPPERRALYHGGQLVLALGVLVFVGNMGRMACGGNARSAAFDPLRVHQRDSGSTFVFAILGMGLFVGGGMMMSVARRGLAGAGVVLDPERAREELEPFSRQTGGMLRDALDEAAIEPGRVVEVVRVRCGSCAALNDEAARFCNACGAPFPQPPGT